MKISIGQYLPGDSVLHRSDPRTKIIVTLAYMVALIAASSFWSYGVAALLLGVSVFSSGIRLRYILKSLKPILILVVIMSLIQLFFYNGENVLFSWKFITVYEESVYACIRVILRIVFLVIGASLLTFTTTSVMLTDGLERLMSPLKVVRFPAHDIAMMMSIALRFIPTFAEETERIMKAQKARGADFEAKNIFGRIKGFIPILVPLFVSAFRRAEDLAIAMNSRCYRGGEGRTRFRELRFTYNDLTVCIIMVVFLALIAFFEIWM